MATVNDIKGFRDLLVDFRGLIEKEYSLKTDPNSYKGENAKDETLPEDWQKKNDAIVGQSEGGPNRADYGNDTVTTSQATQSDPYIHKSDFQRLEDKINVLVSKQMGGNFMMNEEEMGGNGDGWDDIGDESSDDMAEVDPAMGGDGMGMEGGMGMEADDDMEQKMDTYKGGDMMGDEMGGDMSEIVTVLNEIKALMANGSVVKAEKEELEDKVDKLQKSFDSSVKKQVATIMKQHNIKPLNSDMARRVEKQAPVQRPQLTKDAASVINKAMPAHDGGDLFTNPNGVSNGSMPITFNTPMSQIYGDNPMDIHSGVIEQSGMLAKSDNQPEDSMEFRGLFRKLNVARMQNGHLEDQTMYHYNI